MARTKSPLIGMRSVVGVGLALVALGWVSGSHLGSFVHAQGEAPPTARGGEDVVEHATPEAIPTQVPPSIAGLPTVALDKAVHFLTPEGTDIAVGPAVIQVMAEEAVLRLHQSDSGESVLVQAQALEHDESIKAPMVFAFGGKTDEQRLVLLLPNGTGLEAIGSLTGIHARGLPAPPGQPKLPGQLRAPVIPSISPDRLRQAVATQKQLEQVQINVDSGYAVNFDWTMDDRFGLDRNNNGVIDLPNTFEYVHNLPEIRCPKLKYSEPPLCAPVVPQFKVSLVPFPVQFCFRGDINRCNPARVLSYAWKIVNLADGRVTEHTSPPASAQSPGDPPPPLMLTLPEGDYRVTLVATIPPAPGSAQGSQPVQTQPSTRALAPVTRVVKVEDLLIVAVGDSYASGEGNPVERRFPTGNLVTLRLLHPCDYVIAKLRRGTEDDLAEARRFARPAEDDVAHHLTKERYR